MLGKGYTVNLHRFFRVNTLLVPIVAVINCHRLSGLKQHKLIFFRLKGQKSKWVCRPAFLLALQGRIHFLAFCTLWRLPTFLGLWPLSHLQSQQQWVRSCSDSIALVFRGYISLLPPSSAFKDYVVTLRSPG